MGDAILAWLTWLTLWSPVPESGTSPKMSQDCPTPQAPRPTSRENQHFIQGISGGMLFYRGQDSTEQQWLCSAGCQGTPRQQGSQTFGVANDRLPGVLPMSRTYTDDLANQTPDFLLEKLKEEHGNSVSKNSTPAAYILPML